MADQVRGTDHPVASDGRRATTAGLKTIDRTSLLSKPYQWFGGPAVVVCRPAFTVQPFWREASVNLSY